MMRDTDWERLAREHLAAAKMLARPFPALAYSHAGYAVEFALKCRIMRHQRLRWWPAQSRRPGLHTHDLLSLGVEAGIGPDLRALGQGGLRFARAWRRAAGWSAAVRYDPRAFPRHKAADMLDAVDTSGLLQWLLR